MEESFNVEGLSAIGGFLGCILMLVLPILFIVSVILAIVRKSPGWGVAAFLSGALGLGLVGIAIFFGVKEASKRADAGNVSVTKAEDGFQAVSPSGVTFSVSTPGHWSKQALGAADSIMEFGNLFREEYFVVISEPIQDFAPGFTIEEFADLAANMTSEALTDSEMGEMVSVEIGGLPARQCRIVGTVDGIRILYLSTYVKGSEDFYQLMAWTLPSKEDTALPLFRETASTFRELELAVDEESGAGANQAPAGKE